MLDRYLLRYFIAVVDHGNFTRAAEACNVSQPTLSVGIAKLEQILGTRIFVRSSQRVELTGAGTRFLVHARRIERDFNAALQTMDLAPDLSPLRLGVLSSIPSSLVAASVAIARPTDHHRFELLFAGERELPGHLAKGRIDIALTLVDRGSDRFREKRIATEGYALAIPRDHPLADSADIAAEQVAGEVMIVRRHCEALSDTSRFFTERGVRPHFALRSTSDDRVLMMVAAGLGITVMPRCFGHEGVARPQLTGFKVQRAIGWMTANEHEHLLTAPPLLIETIERQFSDLLASEGTSV